jgi:hypothetical protein
MISIYFILNAVETFLLAVYLILVGSEPNASVFFNLSSARLLLVITIGLVGAGFVFLTIRSWPSQSRIRQSIHSHMQNEKSIWFVFLAGIALLAAMLFLLTRQMNQFGDFKLIYQRFEPVFVWVAVMGAQSALFAALWYCARHIKNYQAPDTSRHRSELPILLGFYLAFVVVKLLVVTSTSYGPLGRGDEMTYFDMADSFYRGFFSVAQSHHYPPLYPLSLVPALVFKGYAFEGIKLLNVLYSSSIIFPVYFIARQFLDRRNSLITVFLTCLIPYHLVFPRRILSENLYFPLFIWTTFITFTLPKNSRMRLPWDLLNGAMLAILYLTRYISLAAIPCFLLAWWVKPFEGELSIIKPNWKKIGHLLLLILAMLVVFSPWLAAGLNEHVSLKLLLGFGVASKTDPAQLTFPRLLVWLVLYACYYALVSAPVMNLLLAALTQIDFKNWRDGLGRLISQVSVLMAGFYTAVTRHSWRAYYNRDLPSKIMGRYLIVFSVLYIIIAAVVLTKFDRSRIKSKFRFILWTGVLPFVLTLFAHFVLIRGAIFPTNGDLFKALGSVDGFLTEILGPYFFVMLAGIYGLEIYLMLHEKRHLLMPVLVSGLVIYYLSGIPSYYQSLMDYQTYPWLSQQIAELLPDPDLKNTNTEKISVYLPGDHESIDEAEIYNGLRVRGIDNTEILTYTVDPLNAMPTSKGFIIQTIDNPNDIEDALRLYEFNGLYFTIQELGQ